MPASVRYQNKTWNRYSEGSKWHCQSHWRYSPPIQCCKSNLAPFETNVGITLLETLQEQSHQLSASTPSSSSYDNILRPREALLKRHRFGETLLPQEYRVDLNKFFDQFLHRKLFQYVCQIWFNVGVDFPNHGRLVRRPTNGYTKKSRNLEKLLIMNLI